MNDHAEVCPLSRRAMSQPVSRPLQPGVRFLRAPLATAPTAFLAVHLPLPAARWAYPLFRMNFPTGGPFLFAGGLPSMVAQFTRTTPHRVPFWSKPVSTFGLLLVTTFIGSSHRLVVPAHPLLLSAFVLADSASPRGSAYRLPGGYVAPRASHRAVTGSACPGMERLMEQPVSSGHTSPVKQKLKGLSGRT